MEIVDSPNTVGNIPTSNRARFEALEENQTKLYKAMEQLTMLMEDIKRATNEGLERIERRMTEGKKGEGDIRRTHGDRPQSNISRHENYLEDEIEGLKPGVEVKPNEVRERFRRGGRVESGAVEVERWLNERAPSRASRHTRDHYEGKEHDKEDEFGYEEEHQRQDRRPYGRMPYRERQRDTWGNDETYEGERRKNWYPDRGPKKPKVDFPHFN